MKFIPKRSKGIKPAKNAKRPRPAKSLSAWKLMRASLGDLWRNWRGYIWIMSIVVVPLDILTLSQSIASDPTFNSYAQIAVIIMNVALIWAIIETGRTGKTPRPGRAFYESSSAIVRLILVSIMLLLMLIPAALGTVFYVIGALAAESTGTTAELILIMAVCLLVSLPSVWLLVRFGLGPIVAIATDLRPIAALRYARRLTLGRFWRVLGRYIALIVFIFVLALPIAGLTALLSLLHLGAFANFFFEVVTTFVALPFFNLYLLKMYRSLEHELVPVEPSEPAIALDEAA